MRKRNLESVLLSPYLEEKDGEVVIRYGYNTGGAENGLYFLTKNDDIYGIDAVISWIDDLDFTDPDGLEFLVSCGVWSGDPVESDLHIKGSDDPLWIGQ